MWFILENLIKLTIQQFSMIPGVDFMIWQEIHYEILYQAKRQIDKEPIYKEKDI